MNYGTFCWHAPLLLHMTTAQLQDVRWNEWLASNRFTYARMQAAHTITKEMYSWTRMVGMAPCGAMHMQQHLL
jgi:hypothetical protein